MLIKDVYYQERPEAFEIRRHGRKATIVFPTEVKETENHQEESTYAYVAEKVYTIEVDYTKNLRKRVEKEFERWLYLAKKPEEKEATIEDVVEALKTLTNVVVEGFMYV